MVEILEDPELLKEAAGLSATEDDHRVLDRDIAAAERELKTFERQKQNLLRLYCKGLAEEQELEQQLNEIRAQQRATEQRCDSLLSQREAAALMRQTRTTSVSG